MWIAFGIWAVLVALLGFFIGRFSLTMSNGPKQGTQFGGWFYLSITSLVLGVVAGLIWTIGPWVSVSWLAGALLGAVETTAVYYAACFLGTKLTR